MGFTPSEVDQMSVWEFSCCCDGWMKSRGTNKPEPPTDKQYDRAIAWYENMTEQGLLH